jgi:glycosyltransferase involved in cell wall biosynthesis
VTKKFDRLVGEVKPDVVHHHNISLLGYDLLKKRSNYLNLFTAHDYWLICQQNNLLKEKRGLCQRRRNDSCFFCALKCGRPPQIWRSFRGFKKTIEEIDLIISPSDHLKEILAKEIGVKTITLQNFVPPPPKKIAPATLSNYFLFVGKLEKHKGILNLLQAFKELQRENLRLVILGDGSLKTNVVDYIHKNSLTNLVFYKGFVGKEELYPLYKNALALVIPSVCSENAPLAALEAFSVGTPVIGSNKGGLPEIVRKLDSTLIFEDWGQLKNILKSFKNNKFGSKRVKGIYSRYFSAEAYVNHYTSLIRTLRL